MKRYKEAKSVLRKTIPVARRVLGESTDLVLALRWNYAQTLYLDADATLDDLCEAEDTLEDTERIARRVLGGAHPIVVGIEKSMREVRAALCARSRGAVSYGVNRLDTAGDISTPRTAPRAPSREGPAACSSLYGETAGA